MYEKYIFFFCDCNKMLFFLQADNFDQFTNGPFLFVNQSLAYLTTIVVNYNVRCVECNKSLGTSKCGSWFPHFYRFHLTNLKYRQVELNIDNNYQKM